MAKIHQLVFGAAVAACAQLAAAQSVSGPGMEPGPAGEAAAVPAPAGQEGAASGGVVVGTIVQTQPPVEGESAAELSNDPYIQRREAHAQARQEYRERVEAARREYREDKRAADTLLSPRSGG